MAESVTFPLELNGDGKTYTDDAHPDTGMANGGHRLRFIPALAGAVAMASSAKVDAEAARAWMDGAQQLRDSAASSQAAAAASEQAAASSETNAAASEAAAKASETAAATSEANAAASEDAAKASETAAASSETAAAASETAAAGSASAAAASEANAAESETNAAASEAAAKDSENSAAASEASAAASLQDAYNVYDSAVAIDTAVQDSAASAQASSASADASEASAQASEASAQAAATSETNAASSESAASSSASAAYASENLAEKWAEEDYNVEVQAGKYSALHHATTADSHRAAALQSAVDASIARTGAETAEDNAKASETAAAASESAAATSESNAAASESAAALSESNAADSEAAAKSSENAAAASESAAATSESNAKASETAADSSASAASTSETNAAASESAAASSASAASSSETNAASSASAAASSEDAAKMSENAAADSEAAAAASESSAASSEALAQDWATKTDAPVSGGLYGAKYYADKARAEITGTLMYQGTWDATTAFPTNPKTGDLYKVKVPGGQYNVGDQIVYNGTGWDHIDNTEQVTSVGGNVGDISDVQLREAVKRVDGSGSGLDADLLDGKQASYFLSTEGGTVRGQLNLYTTSNNKDEDLLRLGDRDSGYGFYFRYAGTGTGINNKLEFWTDGQIGDDVLSYQVTQDGVVEFDSTPTVSGNTIYHAGNFDPSSKLDVTGKAADSDKLNGLDASEFARKDAAPGAFTIDQHVTISSPSAGERGGSGSDTVIRNTQGSNNQELRLLDGNGSFGGFWVATGSDYSVEVFSATTDAMAYMGNTVWHAGNFDPDDKAAATHHHDGRYIVDGTNVTFGASNTFRWATSGSVNYIQSGDGSGSGGWRDLRFSPYSSGNAYATITSTGIETVGIRTGDATDDGLNSLQVAGGTRTDTLAAGGVENAQESIDTAGNVQIRDEGQLKMGGFAVQFNAATQSLDFNFVGS